MGTITIASETVPPRGRDIDVNGVQMRCYNLTEYKVIASDYTDYGQVIDEVAKLQLMLQLVDVNERAWKSATMAAEAQVDSLQLSLDDEKQLRRDDNATARRQRWLFATGLVLSVVALGTMGTIEAIK
jgi:uncharacterized membrane protein